MTVYVVTYYDRELESEGISRIFRVKEDAQKFIRKSNPRSRTPLNSVIEEFEVQ